MPLLYQHSSVFVFAPHFHFPDFSHVTLHLTYLTEPIQRTTTEWRNRNGIALVDELEKK